MTLPEILGVRIATVFTLDPDIPVLINKLRKKGYFTAQVKVTVEGASITFIEPPNVIASKGSVRVNYDFGRRTLSIESPISKEVSFNTLEE
jgi:hypothetical protein